jgi:hypothetical protein
LKPENQLFGLITQLQDGSDGTDVLPHACQILCAERQHSRFGVQTARQPVDLAVADRADLTEILSNDDIGSQLPERRLIDGDD